ncbi:MAG: hypothetical protein GY906_15630, partial [bacterium]|nr:hypothetical protein [bacterium]
MTTSIACFVTPHGFGHAARTCAVVEAIHRSVEGMHFEIFTTVPEWFFSTSLTAPFRYHDLFCDVGLVQRSSLVEDPQQTGSRLDAFLKELPERSKQVAARVKEIDCRLVLCD